MTEQKKENAKVLEKRFGGLKKITYLCSPKRDGKSRLFLRLVL